jgi:hypothetical protein
MLSSGFDERMRNSFTPEQWQPANGDRFPFRGACVVF